MASLLFLGSYSAANELNWSPLSLTYIQLDFSPEKVVTFSETLGC